MVGTDRFNLVDHGGPASSATRFFTRRRCVRATDAIRSVVTAGVADMSDFIIYWNEMGGCSYCLIQYMNNSAQPCPYHAKEMKE